MFDICLEHSRMWGYQFNVKKCALMYMKGTQKPVAAVCMDGESVPVVTCYKYLGIDISYDLGFDSMATRLYKKAERVANIVWARGVLEGIDGSAATSLWTGLVRPILEYGAEVWWQG